MKFENPTASHAEKAAEKPAESRPESRPQSKVERPRFGALPTDISQYGEPKLDTGTAGKIEASHIYVAVESKQLGKFFDRGVPEAYRQGAVYERPVSGTVKNTETGLSEKYKFAYVERPDGHVEPSKLERKFSDGTEEVLDREFDKDGRVTKETDILDGRLVREFVNKYDENGKFIEQSVREYDQSGKLAGEQLFKQPATMSGKKRLGTDIPSRGFES